MDQVRRFLMLWRCIQVSSATDGGGCWVDEKKAFLSVHNFSVFFLNCHFRLRRIGAGVHFYRSALNVDVRLKIGMPGRIVSPSGDVVDFRLETDPHGGRRLDA